jgi:hypothetical protein
VGYVPFCSDNPGDTYKKIIDWPNYLFLPEDVYISQEAENLIRGQVFHHRIYQRNLTIFTPRMMTWADKRLTVNQIKSHPFFYGTDWSALRDSEPPFVPHLMSITDTSYFPTDDNGDVPDRLEKGLAFLGYILTFPFLVVGRN